MIEHSDPLQALRADVRALVRSVPDWPKPGILFRDATPLFRHPAVWSRVIEHFAQRYAERRIDAIAGLDARGFIVGAALAQRMSLPFVPLRKQGKLPGETFRQSYALEYGEAALEVQSDALMPGARVLLCDDLIATGGTLLAGMTLLHRLQAVTVEAAVIIALPDLPGMRACDAAGLPVHALLEYAGH